MCICDTTGVITGWQDVGPGLGGALINNIVCEKNSEFCLKNSRCIVIVTKV